MSRRLPLVLILGVIALGCGAGKAKGLAKDGAKVLATIDGVPLTNADLEASLAEYAHDPYIQARYSSPEKRRQLLENLIVFKVMVLEAKRMGLENDPEVVRVKREALAKAYIEREINDRIKAADFGDADLTAYYQAHQPEFTRPEEVRVGLLTVADEAKAQRLAQQARALPDGDRAAFERLVAAHSEDEDSKERGGDSLFFDRAAKHLAPALITAAFGLQKTGEVAGPIATPKGFAILRLTERRPSQVRPLADCANEIRMKLVEKARADRLKAILEEGRKHLKVEIFHDVLAAMPPLPPPAGDAAVPFPAPLPTIDRGLKSGSP